MRETEMKAILRTIYPDAAFEVSCHVGRIDLITDKELIEVKGGRITSPELFRAIGQLMAYGWYYPEYKKVLLLSDGKQDNNKLHILPLIGMEIWKLTPEGEVFTWYCNTKA